jgi:hypothetical protein
MGVLYTIVATMNRLGHIETHPEREADNLLLGLLRGLALEAGREGTVYTVSLSSIRFESVVLHCVNSSMEERQPLRGLD